MHFVKKSQDASSGKVHHSQVHRPGAFRPAVPAVMRPLPPGIICPRTLGPTTHRWKKVDWTHPAIGRIRCSDASLVQLLNASGQRRIAERGGQLDASRFPTHPGNDASPLTGRIQFPDASGQRRIAANWTHPVFRTHPGSDASLGEEITGRIQFPDASGQRRIAVDWTHPVPGRIRAATHRCELDASSFAAASARSALGCRGATGPESGPGRAFEALLLLVFALCADDGPGSRDGQIYSYNYRHYLYK
jgi:hypothetical protein